MFKPHFLTAEQHAQLLENGRLQEPVRGTDREIDLKPVVKLFLPDGRSTWLLTEIDPLAPDVAFGLCDLGLGFPELGAVSLGELHELRGLFGLPVERDSTFTPTKTLSEYARETVESRRMVA